jgi:hypothetical protein
MTARQTASTDAIAAICSKWISEARDGERDYRYSWIAQGFQMARATGRLSGEVEHALRALGRTQARRLMKKAVADESVTMGDVANFLNLWHYGVPSLERGR